MKNGLTTILLLFVLALLPVMGFPQQQGIGAGSFFKTGVDARALGMGGAFVAVANEYSAVYWNPGGLGRVGSPQVGAMHSDMFGIGINYNFLAGALPLPALPLVQDLTVAGTYMEVSVEVRAFDEDFVPIGPIRYSERLVGCGGGFQLPGFGYVGAVAKAYYFLAPRAGLEGADATAFGLGIDAGWLAPIWNNVWVGIAATDIGDTRIKWKNTATEPTDLALGKYTIGLSYTAGNLLLATDYSFRHAFDNILRIGAEYTINAFSLRLGFINRIGGGTSFTAGVGVKVNQLGIDAAWLQNKGIEVEGVHDTILISADFTFGSLGPRFAEAEPQGTISNPSPLLSVEIQDEDGVDPSTIVITVSGIDYTLNDAAMGWDASRNTVTLDLSVTERKLESGPAMVRVAAKDRFGFSGMSNWEFVVDTLGPRFSGAAPLESVTETAPTISVQISDPESKVDPSSITLSILGKTYTVEDAGVDWNAPVFSVDLASVGHELEAGTVTVEVTAADLVGNYSGTTWEFEVTKVEDGAEAN